MKMFHRTVLLLILPSLAACASDASNPATKPEVARIEIAPTALLLVSAGEEHQPVA